MPEASETYVNHPGRDSRRWGIAVVAVAVGVVVAAVAAMSLVSVGPSGDLPRLTIGSGGSGERADAAAMSLMPTRFELADGVDLPAGEGPAWRWSAPTDDDVAGLAGRLGLDGTPVAMPADAGGGWMLGGLSVSATGNWSFSDVVATVSVCDDVAVGVPDAVDGDTPVAPERDDLVLPDVQCEPVDPPAEVPSADEVLATAERIIGPGVAASYAVVASDPEGATVEVSYLVDGQPSGLTGIVSSSWIGTFAYGYLGRPEPVGTYPTVSAARAVQRLADPGRWFGALGAQVGVATAVAEVGATDGSVGGPATGAPLAEPMPLPSVDPAVEPDPAPKPAIEPGPVIEPAPVIEPVEPIDPGVMPEPVEMVVVLVEVAAVQVGFMDAEAVSWSVPGYRFTDSDGQIWEVVAVGDEYLEVVDNVPDEPVEPPTVTTLDGGGSGSSSGSPGDGGGTSEPFPGDLPDDQLVLPDVVGLSEDDATAVLQRAGFSTVRVVARDGESYMVTRDLRYDRANLVIEAGVVTSVYAG